MIIPLASCVVGLHLATYHVDRSAGFNEFNPGVYANCDGFTAGHYRNSERGTSDYIGYIVKTGHIDWTIGVVTGYKGGTMPMILPSVRVSKHMRIAILPPVPKATVNTSGVHLAYEF